MPWFWKRNAETKGAIDLGEWNDIHPANKLDVGSRLALAARAVAYKENILSSGPVLAGCRLRGHEMLLKFASTGSGLTVKGDGPLKGFEVASKDRRFVRANARIEGNNVLVWSEEFPSPVWVRYAWADNPEDSNLQNQEGLPASPFTTEP